MSATADSMRPAKSARCSGVSFPSSRARSRANPSATMSGLRRSWMSFARDGSRPPSSGIARLRLELDLAALEGDRDRMDAVARLELADHVPDVGADGLDAHRDLLADLLRRMAFGHQVHDL